MVAKINHGSNLYGALAYNQEKVDEGLGKILLCNLVMEPADGRFNAYSCMEDFNRFMPSHIRTSKPVVHISLNPHPDDKLTDRQLSEIGREYLERLGYGGQPYMVFKHEDIERQHIHLVTTRIRMDGSPVPDKFEKDRSNKIVQQLEKEYGLIPAKGQKQGEAWQLSPVDASGGNLKKQVANVIRPLADMYKFRSLSEFRALLSLYNIGIEEVKGENRGKPYRGLVYSVLDAEGNRTGKPLKSSLFGRQSGIDCLERVMKKSGGAIKAGTYAADTRALVATALNATRDEGGFRAALREKGIDAVLRRNDEGRLYGVTFIDHNSRTILNGSVLGKEFSANALNARFENVSPEGRREDIQPAVPVHSHGEQRPAFQSAHDTGQPASAKGHAGDDSVLGNLFSILTPEAGQHDDNRPLPVRRRKKKRRYGRQL